MKNTFFFLLSLVLLGACTSNPREFTNPRSYADNTCDWMKELRITHVEFADTATILTFSYKSSLPSYRLSVGPQTYLSDEKDRHYKVLFMTEHMLGEFFSAGPEGTTFHVGFEPLPAGTRIFDMIEGMGSNYFKIIGIHDSTYTLAKPKFSRKELAEAKQIRSSIFKPGVVTLRGTIVGYDHNDGFRTYKLHYSDYPADINNTLALDIDSEGNFESSFDVNYFFGGAIVDHNNNWYEFIAQPGDTLNITFYKDGSVNYSLSDGRPYLLRNYVRFSSGLSVVDNSKFQFTDSIDWPSVLDYAWKCKKRGHDYIDYVASKYNLTAFEYQYANIMMENSILESYLDCRMDISYQYITYITSTEHVDTTKIIEITENSDRILADSAGLNFIADFTANDSLMLIMPVQWVIFNRYKYDRAFYKSVVNLDSLKGKVDDATLYALESYMTDSIHLANDMKLFGASEPSLFGKICMMQDIDRHLETLNTILILYAVANPDSVLTSYMTKMKGLLNDANLEARADRIYQDYFRKQVPYWDLPECRGKEVLKSILANYPGKYVYIDFWSTGCGPCISGIKRCYNNRRELMTGKHDKFVMIFITSDPEEAYEPFRKEWLEGAESYRLSQDDYNVLAGMFNFSAIPHHEMITPDGRAVTNVPEMFVVNPDDPDPELQSKQ